MHSSTVLPTIHVILRQEVPVIGGNFGSKNAKSEDPPLNLKLNVEVDGRLPNTNPSCCSLFRKAEGCGNALTALSHLPDMAFYALSSS